MRDIDRGSRRICGMLGKDVDFKYEIPNDAPLLRLRKEVMVGVVEKGREGGIELFTHPSLSRVTMVAVEDGGPSGYCF